MSTQRYQLYIDGEWRDPANGEWLDTVNPYSGDVWAQIPRGNGDDAEAAVKAARDAFREGPWATMHPRERGELLRKLGDLIAENAEKLAEIEVRDNGKLMTEMLGQMNYLPQWYYYYGGLADKIEGAVLPIDKPDVMTYTRHEPLGVIVGITPWNSPLLLATWKLAPALAAGNTFILKPSEFTSASALELMKLVDQAGFPPGVVNTVTGYGHEVGAALIEHRHVAKVAFTGGELGGKTIYEAAARNLKPVTLELGGKSPNIVFEDANLDNAVKGAVSGIFPLAARPALPDHGYWYSDLFTTSFCKS